MQAQEQIFDYGNIFRLWSKCFLYCLKKSYKLLDHDPTHKTSLHPIWDHFIEPFDLLNFSKFLDRENSYEGSTILVNPIGMKFLQHLYMIKSSSLAKFQPKWHHHVSASSKSHFWTKNAVVKQLYSLLVHFSLNSPGS